MGTIVDASGITSNKKVEQSSQEVELFLNIFLDGLTSVSSQLIKRDAYRNGNTVPNAYRPHPDNALCIYEVENPNAKPSDKEDIEDDLHIYETIEADVSSSNLRSFDYIQRIKEIKKTINNIAKKYCSKKNIKSIRIHIFLFGFDQNCFIFNILQAFELIDEKERSKRIKDIFADKRFLSDKKIKYWSFEYVASFDRLSTSSGIIEQNMSELSWTSNWWERNDALSKNYTDEGAPDEFDFWNAATLCQHTYTCQTEGEKSVIDWCENIIKKGWSIIRGWKGNQSGSSRKESYWEKLHTIDNCRWEDISDISEVSKEIINNQKGFRLKVGHSGFYSRLYRLVDKNGEAQKYMYCTAGTNVWSIADWFSNFAQGLIGWSPQYSQSVKNAKILDSALKDQILLFIGHSLGGGLASNNAMVTSTRHAITFNAAGLNFFRIPMTLLINNPKNLFHISEVKKRIHPRIIEGEILHLSLAVIGELPFGQEKSSYIKINDGKVNWPLLGHINRSLKRHGLEDLINDRQEKSFMYSIQNSHD